jgi:tetratricopeptide (TPR) repeat protein
MHRKRAKDLLVLLFAGSVYFSALVVNDASLNTGKLYGFGLSVLLYFIFGMNGETERWRSGEIIRTILCLLIVAAGLYEAVFGLLQLYGFQMSKHALFRLTGTFLNPGPYAGFLAVVAPVALFYFLNTKGVKGAKFIKYFGLVALITILLVLPAAMSRAAWLAATAGCLTTVYRRYAPKRHISNYYQRYRKRVWIMACALTLVASLSLTGIYYLKKDSADGRLLTWKISLKTAMKHPLGVGLGNFSGAYGDEQAAYFASGQGSEQEEYVAGNPEYAFNEYLQILVESGIVSFLLFMAIVFLSLRSLLKSHAGMAGSLVALLVFACFSYPFRFWEFLAVFVFLIAAENNEPQERPGSQKSFIPYKIRASIAAAVIFSLIIVIRQIPCHKASKTWERSRFLYHSESYKNVIEAYKPLYPYLNDKIQFLFEYARSLSNIGLMDQTRNDALTESNHVLQRAAKISCDPMLYNIMGKNYQGLKQYAEAERCFRKAANIVPNRVYPYYLLALMYAEAGETEKAKAMARIVLTKEPKVHSQAIDEMREKMNKLIFTDYE